MNFVHIIDRVRIAYARGAKKLPAYNVKFHRIRIAHICIRKIICDNMWALQCL